MVDIHIYIWGLHYAWKWFDIHFLYLPPFSLSQHPLTASQRKNNFWDNAKYLYPDSYLGFRTFLVKNLVNIKHILKITKSGIEWGHIVVWRHKIHRSLDWAKCLHSKPFFKDQILVVLTSYSRLHCVIYLIVFDTSKTKTKCFIYSIWKLLHPMFWIYTSTAPLFLSPCML